MKGFADSDGKVAEGTVDSLARPNARNRTESCAGGIKLQKC